MVFTPQGWSHCLIPWGGSSSSNFFFFFWYIINNLLHKKDIVFTMVNTLYLKRIQITQKEIWTERRKSKMEECCVKPQILTHWNKVPTSIGFKRSVDLTISKVWLLHSCQINHIRQARTIFQIFEECFPSQFLHPKIRGTLLSLTSPTGSQTSKKFHSTKHKHTYNGVEDDP